MWLALPGHNLSLREDGTGTEAEAMGELYLLACSLSALMPSLSRPGHLPRK